MRLLVSTLALFLLPAAPAAADTYEVGPGKPYASLQSVEPLLDPGDVALVYGGATYPGGVVLDRPGTAAQPIVIRGVRVGGARPHIAGGSNTIEVRANHHVLEGLEITGGSARCLYHHAHNVVARDLVIHGCPKQGLLGADDDSGSLTLEHSEIYDCGGGTFDHCIYMATDEATYPGSVFRMQFNYVHSANGGNAVKSRAQRNEIYFNWIEGALYHELELIGPDPAGGNALPGVREDSDVVGNVLRKVNTFSVVRFGGDGTGASEGRYRFAFNTVLTRPGGGAVFRLFHELESVAMHGNVFHSVGGGSVNLLREVEAIWVTGSRVVGGDRNWVTTGSQNVPPEWTGTVAGTDPGFAGLAALDLRPAAGAPIRNAGPAAAVSPVAPVWTPPQHVLLTQPIARPADGALDMGAFEYGTPSSPGAGPGGGGGGAQDRSAPRATRVRILRTRRGLVLRFRLSEAARFSGSVRRGGRRVKRLKARQLAAGVRRVRLGRLHRGRYRVRFKLTDVAGNSASKSRRFRAADRTLAIGVRYTDPRRQSSAG